MAAALAARGWGPDALLVPHNLVRHEIDPPPGTPPLVLELLARPLAAADAAALFARLVPEPDAPAEALDFETLLARYLSEIGTDPISAEKGSVPIFLAATMRFVQGLRAPGVGIPPPQRRETAIGTLVIGGPGPDRHGPEAALIVDPGGDDVYVRAPAREGQFSVIVDLAGNDRYEGNDLAEGGHAALVDVAGDDRYDMQSGLGAARGGISLLLDLEGNDEYRVQARGQGFAADGGLGVLWDRAGNDVYIAGGLHDVWGREAGVSYAQGAARGERNSRAGGVGILRDDQGDDRYEAQMFAQGVGYHFGLGLLWDRAGNDRYTAVRYAQGAGVHQAVGTLRDDAGDDSYLLQAGVGQGVGHDMALGVLADAQGDDRYAARYLAQGNAMANGVGLLADLAGASELALSEGPADAAPFRGLPSVGLLVQAVPRSALVRAAAPPEPDEPPSPCPPIRPAPHGGDKPLRALLLALAPGLEARKPDEALYAQVLRRLIDGTAAAIREVPPQEFVPMWALGGVLPCALAAASEAQAAAMHAAFDRLIAAQPATRYAGLIGNALRRRPATGELQGRLVAALDAHPSCAVRSLGLEAWPREPRARGALRSACWREQSAALQALRRLGVTPPPAALPSFLAGKG